MLARFAWHELELPLTEFDSLRNMIFDFGWSRVRNLLTAEKLAKMGDGKLV